MGFQPGHLFGHRSQSTCVGKLAVPLQVVKAFLYLLSTATLHWFTKLVTVKEVSTALLHLQRSQHVFRFCYTLQSSFGSQQRQNGTLQAVVFGILLPRTQHMQCTYIPYGQPTTASALAAAYVTGFSATVSTRALSHAQRVSNTRCSGSITSASAPSRGQAPRPR